MKHKPNKKVSHSFHFCRRLFRKLQKIQKQAEEIIELHPAGADLALVKLKTDVNVQEFLPVCIPEQGQLCQNQRLVK